MICAFPVEEIAEKLGWIRDTQDRRKFRRGNLSVFITNQLFNAFKPGSEHMKGIGPISFIMCSENKTFKEALDILKYMTGVNPKNFVITHYSYTEPEHKQKKLFRPIYKPENRADAEKYLIEERCLSPITVKRLFDSGLAYPSEEKFFLDEQNYEKRKSITFVYQNIDGTTLAYQNIHLTGKRGFKKFSYGSQKKESAFIWKGNTSTAVLFEGVIDLLSFIDLGLWKNETLIAFGGNPLIRKEDGKLSASHPVIKNIPNLILAFDNDKEGKNFDRYFINEFGSCSIIKSTKKDFNEDLKCLEIKKKTKQITL